MPPAVFDDKGNVKAHTKEELMELKGPENLPGYPAGAARTSRTGRQGVGSLKAKTGGKPPMLEAEGGAK